MPPAPVTVSSLVSVSRFSTESSSDSRPINGVRLRGRLVGRVSSARSGRRSRGNPGMSKLIDGDRLRRVVEGVFTEAAQQRRKLPRVLKMVGERDRHQRLAAVSEIEQPRGTIDCRPKIIARAFLGVTEVQCHPARASRLRLRPVARGERLLRTYRCACGVPQVGRMLQKSVAAGLEHGAAMCGDGAAKYFVMIAIRN